MSVAIAVIDNNKAYLASDQQATDPFTLQKASEKVVKQTAFNSRIAVAFTGSQQVAQFILTSMKTACGLYGSTKFDGVSIDEMGAVFDQYLLSYARQHPDEDISGYSVTALIAGIDEYGKPTIAQWDSISRTMAACYHNGAERPTVVFLRPPDLSSYELAVFGNQLMPVAMQGKVGEYLRRLIERISQKSLFVSKECVVWESGA